MKQIRLILTVFIVSFFVTNASAAINGEKDQPLSLKDKVTYLGALKQMAYENYTEALRDLRSLLETNPNSAAVNFKIGECYLATDDYEKAIRFLENAKLLNTEVDKTLPFKLGEAYQHHKEFDKALGYYTAFRDSLSPSQVKTTDDGKQVTRFITQCKFVKEQMAKPYDVKITNLGPRINSEYPDYKPSVTADGLTMVFTSRRANSEGGQIDPTTNGYYEDIYISNWIKDSSTWSNAEGIPGAVNTKGHDAVLSIAPDGTQIFVYRNDHGGDIYVSNLKFNGKWSKPKALEGGVNSSYYDCDASLTSDGNTLYFTSNRPGGFGDIDIYRSIKQPDKTWGKPENLGPQINTEDDEIGVYIHPDGKALFFSSKGHVTMGGFDVFMSVLDEATGKWGKPINLGYPINTVDDDVHFSISTDYKKAWYSSKRDNGLGENDIYELDLTNYYKSNKVVADLLRVDAVEALVILKGKVMDTKSGGGIEAKIDITNVDTKEVIGTTTSNAETGEYFITVPSNKNYEISINRKSFKQYLENYTVPASKGSGTSTIVKHFFIEKQD